MICLSFISVIEDVGCPWYFLYSLWRVF